MLLALGVSRVALLSNNPDKARQLRRFGMTVTARVATGVHLCAANARYLATKAGIGPTRSTSRCQRAELRSDGGSSGRISRSAWFTVTASCPVVASARRRRV
jgi:GTP cyclohydrolase II